MSQENNSRGNQTGYRLDEIEGSPQTIGDLYNPGHAANGDEPRDGLVTIDSNQDLSRPAKVTLGSYLSNSTQGRVGVGRPNVFQVPPGSDVGTADYNENMSTGRPVIARLDIESNGSTLGTYMDHVKGYLGSNDAARRFESTKHSDYGAGERNPFQDPDINIKNYSDPDARRRGQDGNSILLNIEPRGSQGPAEPGNPAVGPLPAATPAVQRKISEVLKQNRFNPLEKAFIENHTWRGTGVTLQRKLGVHEKDNGKEIKQGLLEQVGLKLMIRATGHSVPGQDLLDSTNDLRLTNNLAPLIPSAPQLTGLPLIDVINLRAGNVAVAEDILGVGVTPESARAEYINDVSFEAAEGSTGSTWNEAFVGKSYGVLNSHIEPFGGPLPIGTFTTTVAGIIAIVGASALVSILPLILGGSTEARPRRSTLNADPATLIKGKRAFLGSEADGYSDDNIQEFVLSLLGIPKTDHNWGLCLLVGIGAFFGIEIKPGIAGQGPTIDENSILESLFNLVTAPGYYAVIIRNAIRDTEQIVRAVEEFAQSAADVNVVKAISGLFKIVESITTSALYRFIMAMTALGNQILNYTVSPSNDIDGYPKIENLRHRSRISETTRGTTLKSAQLDGDLGSVRASSLAWKHSAPRSVYILPSGFDTALTRSPWINKEKTPGKLIAGDRIKTGTKISREVVQEVESKLEGEYVPFYFHDLRTNEIISFHAFLTDLSDGFAATYNSTAGYGRADEVMVYNNTKRSISFGFHVVATSVEDLDVMYWNVNKLISMLYPQYSKGRTMVNGDTKFVQPFSQIPTASPMIRLRIGDVIRGNYSKFGLARLFGLGGDTNSFSIEGEASQSRARQWETDYDSRLPGALKRARSELMSREKGVGDTVVLREISRDNPLWCNRQGQAAWLGTEPVPSPPRRRRRSDTELVRNRYSPDVTERLRILIENGRGRRLPINTEVKIVEVRSFDRTISDLAAGLGDSLSSLTSPGDTVAVQPEDEPQFLVELVDVGRAAGISSNDSNRVLSALGNYKYFYVLQSDVIGYSDMTIRLRADEIIIEDIGQPPGTNQESDIHDFFSGETGKNSIVRSFESTRGRGLAGFVTNLSMDWADVTWETDPGMRAPKSMKLTVTFAPLHDIPMGLDSDGMMRSVAYNVGSMSRVVGRDQYEDGPTPDSTSSTSGGPGETP